MEGRCVIRVDGGSAIGLGHVSRCLTLAQELQDHDLTVEFVCRELPGMADGWVEDAGFPVHRLPARLPSWREDAAATAAVLEDGAAVDWLVVDHYGLDARWERVLRPKVRRIFVVDDLADRPHDCDGLLDQNLREVGNPYAGLLPAGAAVFLGPDYALLRKDFRRAAQHRRSRDGAIRRLLVFFGGSDPTGETLKALAALERIEGRAFTVDVIVGAANPDKDQVAAKCAALSWVNFHCQTADMARFLEESDCALGAAGMSSWERLAAGVPAVVVAVADNQMENLRQLDKLGAALVLGPSSAVTVEDWARAIADLLAAPERVRRMAEKACGIVDGEGAGRIAAWLAERAAP